MYKVVVTRASAQVFLGSFKAHVTQHDRPAIQLASVICAYERSKGRDHTSKAIIQTPMGKASDVGPQDINRNKTELEKTK